MARPSRKELILAVEALAALVDDAYPALPLDQLAHGLGTYRDSGLTVAHFEALRRIQESVLASEPFDGTGDDDL